MTERLAALAAEDTRRIEARQPLLDGAEADEKSRLANAYRLELARIKQDQTLIQDAPPELLSRLRKSTVALHETLAAHELALNAVKVVSEGTEPAAGRQTTRTPSTPAPPATTRTWSASGRAFPCTADWPLVEATAAASRGGSRGDESGPAESEQAIPAATTTSEAMRAGCGFMVHLTLGTGSGGCRRPSLGRERPGTCRWTTVPSPAAVRVAGGQGRFGTDNHH